MASTILPTLYGIDKSGRTKMWQISVQCFDEGNRGIVTTTYGLLDGKKQTNERTYTVGKNIGKSNETTPYAQALSEARSKWTDKKDKEGYTTQDTKVSLSNEITETNAPTSEKENTQTTKILPMLAHVFDPSKSNTKKASKSVLNFPCYIQPKLDGVRCVCYLSDDKTRVLAQSRTGAYFESVGHITTELLGPFSTNPEFNGLILDGELYSEDMPFEALVGLVKKKKLTEHDIRQLSLVSYNVYDIVDLSGTMTFSERYAKLERVVNTINNPYITLVTTVIGNNENDFREFFASCIRDGFEGVMLRTVEGKYRCNYRSHDLQKYKEFMESEYEIVGYREAEGRDKGTVVWICKVGDGTESIFSVRPKGSMDSRRELYTNGFKYVGKMLTVVYQELSEGGVPRFPVGKCIREGY